MRREVDELLSGEACTILLTQGPTHVYPHRPSDTRSVGLLSKSAATSIDLCVCVTRKTHQTLKKEREIRVEGRCGGSDVAQPHTPQRPLACIIIRHCEKDDIARFP